MRTQLAKDEIDKENEIFAKLDENLHMRTVEVFIFFLKFFFTLFDIIKRCFYPTLNYNIMIFFSKLIKVIRVIFNCTT